MSGATIRAAVGGWRDLATRAARAVDRPDAVRAAARSFAPELGDLSPIEGRRLTSAVREILEADSPFIVPMHTSQPYWVPSMLDDGFRWQRPRIDVAGRKFEPYEDKLREYHALGRGERSEDFLFTDVRLVPRAGSLEQSLVADAARLRATYGSGSRTGPGFGPVTLAFDPDATISATMLPATQLLGQYGTRAGTIEHLPGVIASRIAIEGGARSAVERYGLEVLGAPSWRIDDVLESRAVFRRELSHVLARSHDDRIRGVRAIMHNVLERPRMRQEHPILKHNPVEAHVRGLTPGNVRFIDIETGLGDLGTIAPARLDMIEQSAARRGVRLLGVDEHRQFIVRAEQRSPGMGAGIIDAPRTNTAIGTSQLRLDFARRRAAHAAAAPA